MPVITNIEDLRVLAQKRVPRMFYDYADSGSWTEGTYRANETDFHKIKLRQRVAVNMENRTTATKMVGIDTKMPVCIAPVGLTGMQHADGEMHAAMAAKKFGIPFTLSTMSICSIEDIAQATDNHPFWFQLYVMKDRAFIERLHLGLHRGGFGGLFPLRQPVETIPKFVKLAQVFIHRRGASGNQGLCHRLNALGGIFPHAVGFRLE